MIGDEVRKSEERSFRAAARVIPLGAVMLVLAALPGCKKEAAPEPEVTVQAEHPEQGPIAEQVTADAVLQPMAQAAIVPRVTAPVKKFYVQRGQRVHAGELLVTLENADLAAAAMDTKGSYEAAQAAYDTATKAQAPADVLTAESDFAQAKANLELNQNIVKSRQQLFQEGAIPGRDLDTAQAALVQAQAAYDAAKQHLDAVHSVSHEAALKSAQGQLTSAEGKYQGAQAQIDFSEIRSPIEGVVTDRPLFAGETAAAGAPLITVMDTTSLIAKTHIAQSLAVQLKAGNQASVQVPGISDPVPAKVSMVSPALDTGSTTVEVWLKVDNKTGRLKVGTPVKAVMTGTSVAHALTVPLAAILTADNGAKSVMVIGSDGAAHKKAVTLGVDNGTDVEVISGLTTADTVITSGSYGLDEGTKVKTGPAGGDDDSDSGGKG
jgi:multidrug efflux pump subunit AcrA (membrane-fusion protein)